MAAAGLGRGAPEAAGARLERRHGLGPRGRGGLGGRLGGGQERLGAGRGVGRRGVAGHRRDARGRPGRPGRTLRRTVSRYLLYLQIAIVVAVVTGMVIAVVKLST